MLEILPQALSPLRELTDDKAVAGPDYIDQISLQHVPPQILSFLRADISNAKMMLEELEDNLSVKAALVGYLVEQASEGLQDLFDPWKSYGPVSARSQAALAALGKYLDGTDSSLERLESIKEALKLTSEDPYSLDSKQNQVKDLLTVFILLKNELASAHSLNDSLLLSPAMTVKGLLDALARACLALDLELDRPTSFAARYLLDGQPELFESGEHEIALLSSVAFFRRTIDAHLVDERYETLRASLRQLEQRTGWIAVLDWIAEQMKLSASDSLLTHLYNLVAKAIRDDIRALSDEGRCVLPVGWFSDQSSHSILAVVGRQAISLLNSDLGTLTYHDPKGQSSNDFVRPRIDFTVSKLSQDDVEAYLYQILHLSRRLRDYSELSVENVRNIALKAHYTPLETLISTCRGIAAHGIKVAKIQRSHGSCPVEVLKRLLKFLISTSDYSIRRVEIKLLVYTLFQPWLQRRGLGEIAWNELALTISKLWRQRNDESQMRASCSSSPDSTVADLSGLSTCMDDFP